jgi:hypothetical protein
LGQGTLQQGYTDLYFLHQKVSLKSHILHSFISNHKPISLHLQALPNYGPLPFRFNNLWLNHQDGVELVKATLKTWIPGKPIFIWEQKLMLVKQAIKWWAKSSFISPSNEKEQIKGKLERLQKNSDDKEIIAQLEKEELDLPCKYQNTLRREEEYWHLKSRSLWLKVGDKNTRFFHNQAKFKQSRNNVVNITLEDGSIVSKFEDIKKATKNHFANL